MKKFNAIEHIEDFNVIRCIFASSRIPFSVEEFRDRLREKNLPNSIIFVNEMKNAGIIENNGEGLLTFTTNQPIHYKVLESIYSTYTGKLKEYQKTYRTKKEAQKRNSEEDVKAAIDLLKGLGFQIYSPVGDLFEKLLFIIKIF